MKFLKLFIITLISLQYINAQTIIDCEIIDDLDLSQNLLLKFNFNNNTIEESGNSFSYSEENITYVTNRFDQNNLAADLIEDSYIKFDHNSILKPEFPFSFSFWTYPYQPQLYSNYIYTSDLLPNVRAGFNIQTLSSTNQLHFFYGNGCYNPVCRISKITTLSVPNIEWTHIVILVKGPKEIEFYFNGCPVESTFSGTGDEFLDYSTSPSYIGHADPSNFDDGKFSYFDGKIDEFYFWDREINELEIKYLYDNFNMPTIELEDEYTLTKIDNELILEISSDLENVSWSNATTGNVTLINEGGDFWVEGYHNCHKFCHYFYVNDLSASVVGIGSIDTSLCFGESIIINNTVYNNTFSGADTITIALGCDSIININVHFYYEDIDLQDTIFVKENQSYTFNQNLIDFDSIIWSPDIDISCTHCNKPTFTPSVDMKYTVCIYTTTGCLIKDTIFIRVLEENSFFTPNIFSPNDDGVNDYFSIFSKNISDYDLFIYDRWGNKVFEAFNIKTNKPNLGWDGTFNGEKVNSGIYAYYAKIKGNHNLESDIIKTGSITVIK